MLVHAWERMSTLLCLLIGVGSMDQAWKHVNRNAGTRIQSSASALEQQNDSKISWCASLVLTKLCFLNSGHPALHSQKAKHTHTCCRRGWCIVQGQHTAQLREAVDGVGPQHQAAWHQCGLRGLGTQHNLLRCGEGRGAVHVEQRARWRAVHDVHAPCGDQGRSAAGVVLLLLNTQLAKH